MNLWNKVIDKNRLESAWKQIKSKNPAPGIDQISCEEFALESNSRIERLYQEIMTDNYEPLPVKIIEISEKNKIRKIGLYSIRDKIIQKNLSNIFNEKFDSLFSDSCYGFRPKLSAVDAANKIDSVINKKIEYVLRTDIKSFFNNINHGILFDKLKKIITEDKIINLIKKIVKNKEKFQDTISKRRNGICQGSSISPFLSNIYLNSFDQWLNDKDIFYIRYADDILLLSNLKSKLKKIKNEIEQYLSGISLKLNNDKTRFKNITDKFIFLGFEFNQNGKKAAVKAKNHMYNNLEETWYNNDKLPVQERLNKLIEIYRGWNQYFFNQIDEIPDNKFVYLSLIRTNEQENNISELNRLKYLRNKYQINDRKITEYLLSVWKKLNFEYGKLIEYEILFGSNSSIEKVSSQQKELIKTLNELYEQLEKTEEIKSKEMIYDEIMQLYTDVAMYQKASKIFEIKNRIKKETKEKEEDNKESFYNQQPQNQPFSELLEQNELFTKYKNLFLGRKETYKKAYLDENGKRKYHPINGLLSDGLIKKHIKGQETIATYVSRKNNTVKYLVLDIDISKKILLKSDKNKAELDLYWNKVFELCNKIKEKTNKMDLNCYFEYSGYRGVHIWLFFTSWIPSNYAVKLSKKILKEINYDKVNIKIEIFPEKQNDYDHGKAIKLPLGKHIYTNNLSYFFKEPKKKIVDLNDWLYKITKISLDKVKNLINLSNKKTKEIKNKSKSVSAPALHEKNIQELNIKNKSIKSILSNCSLLKFLVFKAKESNFLNHQERLDLSFIFFHIKDIGEEFLHQVMSYTLNYNYDITQKYIKNTPAKPVSCIRLREKYKNITAHYNCDCSFDHFVKYYPSPIIHAIKNNDSDKITKPISTRNKKNGLNNEDDLGKEINKTVKRLIELKKHKKGILNSINNCENKLNRIFDQKGIDELNINLGTLKREKSNKGFNWIIEI